MLSRPKVEEFLPHFQEYVNLVPEGNLLEMLKEQTTQIVDRLSSVTEEQEAYRYAEGKWSLKEVIGHMTDTERIMSYRLLRSSLGYIIACHTIHHMNIINERYLA
ncbi:DinB family protein [Paenibacillus sp. D2_2]|uniref:DinB family protein n=1 Tax=Paenibacillus sp. D2_2 TaxID=3073092 RepID=UPI00281514A1|nr:DinB family protein [Paenibacillus sp. D2_2]WMT42475.1 DinB family protein [Paenibacillus sp. D2_2]